MNAIEEIYNGFLEREQFPQTGDIDKLTKEFMDYIGDALSLDKSIKLSGIVFELAESRQKLGFITGFKLGVCMMKDCK